MNARELTGHLHGWFRIWFRKVWQSRGGGLYAVGFAISFAFLEVRTVILEFLEADSVAAFIREQLLEFVFRFALDSLVNLVQSFIWPVFVIESAQPWGAIALAAAFVLFPRTLKKPIERWLFHGDGDEQAESAEATGFFRRLDRRRNRKL